MFILGQADNELILKECRREIEKVLWDYDEMVDYAMEGFSSFPEAMEGGTPSFPELISLQREVYYLGALHRYVCAVIRLEEEELDYDMPPAVWGEHLEAKNKVPYLLPRAVQRVIGHLEALIKAGEAVWEVLAEKEKRGELPGGLPKMKSSSFLRERIESICHNLSWASQDLIGNHEGEDGVDRIDTGKEGENGEDSIGTGEEEEREQEQEESGKERLSLWGNYCLYCGAPLQEDVPICPSCHAALRLSHDPEATVTFCPHCEKDIPMASLFCPHCGKRVIWRRES